MNALLAQIIREFSLDLYRPIVQRKLDLGDPLPPRAGNLATVIVGMRRSGKTYRLFQEMERLLSDGVDHAQLLYFNFEDNRIAPATPKLGDDLLNTFRELDPDAYSRGVYLFFDEIQEMQGWDTWLRRVIDTTKATIYVTGSSSKLLLEEISTAFRGRSIIYELLPYSFGEVFAHELPDVDPRIASTGALTQDETARTARLFENYLLLGGFPAIQGMPLPRAISILQSYAQRVVAKDVVERYGIANARACQAFSSRLLASTGREISLRKTEEALKSQGLTVSRNALANYLEYYEDAFLLGTVREFSRTISESSTASPKIYAIDPGLAMANSPATTQDKGQRLETVIYLELRRQLWATRSRSICSLKTRAHGFEIDFVSGDALLGEATSLVQVSATLASEKTRMRELRALEEAMAERGLPESTLVTLDDRPEDITLASGIVHVMPAWQWCLAES